MGEIEMKQIAVKTTALLLAAGFAATAWSAESLQDVMKRRNLSQQDLLAAAKTYVPTGKRDEFSPSVPAASPARSSCMAFRPCAS
jgi:hypothetical protein